MVCTHHRSMYEGLEINCSIAGCTVIVTPKPCYNSTDHLCFQDWNMLHLCGTPSCKRILRPFKKSKNLQWRCASKDGTLTIMRFWNYPVFLPSLIADCFPNFVSCTTLWREIYILLVLQCTLIPLNMTPGQKAITNSFSYLPIRTSSSPPSPFFIINISAWNSLPAQRYGGPNTIQF